MRLSTAWQGLFHTDNDLPKGNQQCSLHLIVQGSGASYKNTQGAGGMPEGLRINLKVQPSP